MIVSECFSSTYKEAREKFLQAAASAGCTLQNHAHPSLRGPSGEALAVDVAVLGRAHSQRVMMIVSGTHGVEGHAGSGCQVHCLRSGLAAMLAESVCLVLVHAINPYGFAYSRRTNEDNVDLNRNFVNFGEPRPANPLYAEYARAYLPAEDGPQNYEAARARLEREAEARGGYQFFKKATQPGQYEFPQGLYYGGTGPTWSNTTIGRIYREFLKGAERCAVLDLHTGLGPRGVGEIIFMTAEGGQHANRFTPPVSCAGAQGSVSANVSGPLVTAAYEHIDSRNAICCALEFGTVPVDENVKAQIFENWAYHYLPPQHPLRLESTRRLRDAYYCDEPEWRANVTERAGQIMRELHRCL